MELRIPGGQTLIAWRLNRSFAWNAAHPREPQAPEERPARSFYSAALLKLWDELDEADALDEGEDDLA